MDDTTEAAPEAAEPDLQSRWPTEPAGKPPDKRGALAFLRELPVLIAIAFILALLMKTFLVQAFYIPSESMEPTLHGCTGCNGDRVLVNKLVWRLRDPRRGEIVVFIAEHDSEHKSFLGRIRSFFTEGLGVTTPAEKDFIKRVIGLPGEIVEVNDKGVYITPVHGKRFRLNEPYIARPSGDGTTLVPCGRARSCPEGPPQRRFRVPKDSYFVMGDNRENSQDSRFRGAIKRSDFIGKAFVKIWPLSRASVIQTPAYPRPVSKKKTSSPQAVPFASLALGIGAISRRRRAPSVAPRAR
jgi:signal peptidase I